MSERRLKITPGKWKVSGRCTTLYGKSALTIETGKGVVAATNGYISSCGNDEDRFNAYAIAEAGTVCNELDLMPKEIAEQRKELLETLKGMLAAFAHSSAGTYGVDVRQQAIAAIARAEGR